MSGSWTLRYQMPSPGSLFLLPVYQDAMLIVCALTLCLSVADHDDHVLTL